MFWHAEITERHDTQIGPGVLQRIRVMTLRGYHEPNGYRRRRKFIAVAQAVADLGAGTAFFRAALRVDGEWLGRQDWRDLACLMRDRFKTRTVSAGRRKKPVFMDVSRWAR